MPESWCCSGARCWSMLGLRVVLGEGRASMKRLWMEPLRREGPELADEKDESLRRDFWRLNWPVTTPNARERELECECCEAPQSTYIVPSLTASSTMPVSFPSL